MKILVSTGPKELHVETIPSPEHIPADSIRVKTLYSGISHGTEMGIYQGTVPQFQKKRDPATGLFLKDSEATFKYPFRSCDPGVWYLGYSNVGRVLEVGKDISDFKIGDIVYTHGPHQSEVIVRADDQVVKIPAGVDPKHAIVLTNLITTHNGILDSNIKLGDVVVVFGLGVLGQLYAQLAKMSGAAKVYGVDVIDKRLAAAKSNGCDEVFNSATTDVALAIRNLTGGKGPDVVAEVSGNAAALNEAIRTAAIDTTVTVLGWHKNNLGAVNLAGEFHHNRIGIKQSQSGRVNPAFSALWTRSRRAEFCQKLLSKLQLDNIITHVVPYENVAEAYALIDQHPEEVIQVVLSYEE